MALFKKQLAKVDEFEEMLKKAVNGDGKVKNVGKNMFDVTYKDAIFSVLNNKEKNKPNQIMKFFCSKKECEHKFGLDFDMLVKEAEELDFSMNRVPMYGKSIIMELELDEAHTTSKEVRNIFEQVLTATEVLKARIAELWEAKAPAGE